MGIISKTANRRAKRTKIWDSVYYSGTVHICTVLLMPDSLSLVWGHSVHFAKFPILQVLKSAPLPIFIRFIQTLYKVSYSYRLSLFWRSAKNCKKLWHFEIFLTQDHMQLEFSVSPTIFIAVHLNFVTTLATMVNLNAC